MQVPQSQTMQRRTYLRPSVTSTTTRPTSSGTSGNILYKFMNIKHYELGLKKYIVCATPWMQKEENDLWANASGLNSWSTRHLNSMKKNHAIQLNLLYRILIE